MKAKISAFIGIIAALIAFSINNMVSAPGADQYVVFFQGCIYALEGGVIAFGVTYVALYVWEHLFPSHFEKTMKKISSKVEDIANSAFDE